MAIMLGAFVVIGQPIGPSLLTTQIETSFVLAATVALANLAAIPMFFAVVPWIVRLAALRREHIVPFAIALALFAAMYQYLHWTTLAEFVAGGILGVILKARDWARAPFLLGFILGPLAETSFIQTSQVWGWSMFLRPATIAMIVLFAVLLVRTWRNSKHADFKTRPGDAWLSVPMAGIFVVAALAAWSLPGNASPFPLVVCVVGLGLAVVLSVMVLRGKRSADEGKPETFSGVFATAGYCALCVPLGVPLASAVYVLGLLRQAGTGLLPALAYSLALAALQLWLFSLTVDIFGEPLVRGYLAGYLGLFG